MKYLLTGKWNFPYAGVPQTSTPLSMTVTVSGVPACSATVI